MNDLRDTCQGDRAADRAASAARTLAAIAHDAARKYVKRDAVTPESNRRYADVVFEAWFDRSGRPRAAEIAALDTAERERQARLRRWQTPPLSNRKDG